MATKELKRRSFTKAFSWRLTGTLDTIFISWLITGETHMAFAIGGIEVFTKFFLYMFHERIWNKVKWGRYEDNENIEFNI